MTLYSNVLEYFKECKIAFADRFVPYYTISACNHLMNLENQKREFALDGGRVINLRLHVFFVAPPGFMKTLLLSKLLDGPFSVFGSSGIGTGFEGAMTEAGYVGTIKAVDGQPIPVYGAAHEHQENILGIDEFSSLTNSMRMEHSVNLDTAMLTSLDSGYLIKRLAMGKLRYVTQLTLWTGSQPSRFDLSSGLGRRLIFLYFIPSREEEDTIRLARRSGKNVNAPMERLTMIRKDVEDVKTKIRGVKKIIYDRSIYEMIDKLRIPHYEEELFERMALGYTVANKDFGETIVVSVDNELIKIVNQAHMWRNEIKRGSEYSQAMTVLREMTNCPLTEVKQRLTNLGWTWDKSTEVINNLQRQKLIEIITEKASERGGRPKQIVIVNE